MDEKELRLTETPSTDASPTDPQKKKKAAIALISLAVVAVIAVICALLVREYVVTTYIVDGESMAPTLDGGVTGRTDDGDTLLLNMLGSPERGDIVVFTYDWNGVTPHALVKRVIALPGDKVEISDGKLFLNGELLYEPYLKEDMDHFYDGFSVTVPDGHFFAMGDNRNNSTDSRAIGCVPQDKLIGVCFLIASDDGKLRIHK